MKWKNVLALCCLACLLWGCTGEKNPEASTQPTQTQAVPETQPETVLATKPGVDAVEFGGGGSVRVDYTTNISSVRYITSADRLPNNEALAGYDESYFETKALLIVYETVSSGMVQVGIESISVSGGDAVVTLSHENVGQVGTPVVTTWLVWAEVEQWLDLSWTVANPAMESGVQKS